MAKNIKVYPTKNGKGDFVKREGSKERTYVPKDPTKKSTKFNSSKKID